MTNEPGYQKLKFDPVADPAAVVTQGNARFTVLASRLLRLEYAPDGRFEDRPSQVFWYRRQPVPRFAATQEGGQLTITTDHLQLIYDDDQGFTSGNPRITLLAEDTRWHFGAGDVGNLLGTTRTLDTINGRIELEDGLLSRSGWTLVDDSASLVFNDSNWLVPREAAPGAADAYFLGYGRSYHDCLRDYMRVAGGVPLLPRWALGNWWSRYWAYTQEELTNLMRSFREHAVPLAVCIVDMDWHLVDVGPGVNGWTGYTWNRDLFPEPEAFIEWLHQQGLRTALNLHPALGVRPHEEMYPAMAERMGIDPEEKTTIDFDIANPEFASAYFELLHHPQEVAGVDFWWMDWQQGKSTRLSGLDPLWWLNHLHFYDLARSGKRPFVFSRWGGLGNHRYPIGFSGDTIVTWDSLAFQPYFTATAANVGYGWWSHDIGGHMGGIEDAELYTRWVQFGVFSPIFRLHSTKNTYHERRPWGYDAETLRITRAAMQLRHAMIPYLYTMSRLNETEALAPVRPMYHDYPDLEEAYNCPQQYMFGTSLLVAPFTAPADADTRLARQVVWLPPGDWYDFFTGEYRSGNAWYAIYGGPAGIPVFARAGSIIPLAPLVGWGGVGNPTHLDVHVFAGGEGSFTLFEDDGETLAYQSGQYSLVSFEQASETGQMHLTIRPAGGDPALSPDRTVSLHVHGVGRPGEVSCLLDGVERAVESTHEGERLLLADLLLPAGSTLDVTLAAAAGAPLLARGDRLHDTCLRLIAAFKMDSYAKQSMTNRLAELIGEPLLLADYGVDLAPAQMRALLETIVQAGVHEVPESAGRRLIVMWNNLYSTMANYHVAITRPRQWHLGARQSSEQGFLPRFRGIEPPSGSWRCIVDYASLTSVNLGSR